MKNEINWREYFQGRAPFSRHLRIIIPVICLYLGLFAIAALLHSKPFTFQTVCVSNLGNPSPNQNPRGWWLFSLAMIVAGPFMFGHVNYLYYRLLPTWPKYAQLMRISMVLGSIGMPLVGIINESNWPPHIAVSLVAFLGLGIPSIFSLPLLIAKWIKHDPWPSVSGITILYCVLSAAAVRMIVLMTENNFQPSTAAQFESEWWAFGVVLVWLTAIFFMSKPKSPS